MTHIQKIAPGPPTAIASATPARLPVPTLAAVPTQNAPNDETPLSERESFASSRTISPNRRNCTKRERIVK